jgi:hypothetical protein
MSSQVLDFLHEPKQNQFTIASRSFLPALNHSHYEKIYYSFVEEYLCKSYDAIVRIPT